MAAKKKKKSSKIIRYRKPLNINIGMIIFALIFVYMSFSVYTYLKKEKIQFYEVVEGGIVNDQEYTGLILRDEVVKYTDRAGTINYYVREGRRASVGTTVYSIDETNEMAAYLQQNSGDQTLSTENLENIKKQLSSFNMNFDEDHFSTVYDTKYSLDALVLEYANFDTADSLAAMEAAGISFIQVRADQAGTISYAIDSFEDVEPSQVEASMFDRSNYKSTILRAGDTVENGGAAYKVAVSDNWSIVFPMSDEDISRYSGEETLEVAFKGTDLTISGDFSVITGADGASYGQIDFNKYMVEFLSDRFVEFEIVTDKVDGLKIPISAVTEKEFYLVPKEYLDTGGDSTESGFLKEIYSENGTSVVFTPTTLYYETEDYYYIEDGGETGFTAGDYIVKPESSERYQIGAKATLEGVYNMNKGYTVFKQIDILASNNEYYVVRKNMDYGLSVYDHIVLDASTVEEGKLIYQ